MNKRNIPRSNNTDLLIWSQNFIRVLKENTSVLKLDAAKINELDLLVKKYETALEKYLDPNHIRSHTVKKNEAAEELRNSEKKYIVQNIRYNPEMTTALQILMMYTFDTPRRKVKKPTQSPYIEIILGIGKVTLKYYDSVTHRAAKPDGVRGIQHYYDILDKPPKSPEELSKKVSISSGTYEVIVTEEDRGKALYTSSRWENTRGEPGPWSEIIKVYIP